MFTDLEAIMIAEYEQLRRTYDHLEQVVAWMEGQLVQFEWLLPEAYAFPGDSPPQPWP